MTPYDTAATSASTEMINNARPSPVCVEPCVIQSAPAALAAVLPSADAATAADCPAS